MKIQDGINKRANNFTLMRLMAAMAVLYGHSYVLSLGVNGGEDPISRFLMTNWGESLPALAVDMFFVISGFLVTGSYVQRDNLFEYIEARALRIFPGLIVAVLFCILVVGLAATTEPLTRFLTSPTTISYLKHNVTLLSGVQFDLPGVFATNPYPLSVNGSLWTLPIELRMYFCIAILGACTLLRSENTFNLLFIVALLIFVLSTSGDFPIELGKRNPQLVILFLFGSFFFINRKRIPLGFSYLAFLAIISYFSMGFFFSPIIKFALFSYFVLLCAFHPVLKVPSIDHWGDVSYGLYIYAFPVQQTIAHLISNVTPMGMFALAMPVTVISAMLSWRYIEKPALRMKGNINFGRKHKDIRVD